MMQTRCLIHIDTMIQRLGIAGASSGAFRITGAALGQQQPLFSTIAARSALPANIPDFRHFLAKASHQRAQDSNRRVYIQTYGCQMNTSDTEILLGILAQRGYARTAEPLDADVVLLNTCAIREHAEQKIFHRLGELRAQLSKNRAAAKRVRPPVVGILGCMAERLKERLFSAKTVDIVAGPDALRSVPDLIDLFIQSSTAGMDAGPEHLMNVQLSAEETYADITPIRPLGAVCASVSIMRGCNNMCSFCIVPYTRGRERSRPAASIVEEVKQLYADGVREVLLLGQNVNSYADVCALDAPPGMPRQHSNSQASTTYYAEGFSSIYKPKRVGAVLFAELLERVAGACPEMRIRFMSPHPKDFGDDVLQVIARHANICKQLHMPAQSGSTDVLRRMHRGYTREVYDALITRARNLIPEIALSTDLILGFCGENEEDYAQTLDLLRTVGYDQAFLFAYSLREKTHAARHLQDDVPEEAKRRRLNEAIAVYKGVLAARNRAEVGRRHLVLNEGPSLRDPAILTGRACTGKRVFYADTAVPSSYCSARTSTDHLFNRATVRLMPGDYVAVEVAKGTDSALRATPLARSSIAEFVSVEGSTAPLQGAPQPM